MRENKDWGLRKVAFGRNNRVVGLTRFEMKKRLGFCLGHKKWLL